MSNKHIIADHGTYIWTTFDRIACHNWKKWEYNRDPVECKINEITQLILKHKRCEGIIYVCRFDNITQCYDGWHRYNAIQRALKVNPELGSCIVQVFLLKTTNNVRLNKVNVIEHFRELNKCDPVSDIYYENPDTKRRRIIEATREYYHANFKKFFTTSKNPRSPNENISRFDERLLYIYNERKPESFEKFKELLQDISNKNKFNTHKIKEYAKAKCVEHNFFLFALKNWHLE
jgi:hypothetical protein